MAATPSPTHILRGDALDFYLSQGYYRMHQDLFTCRFLPINNDLYTVHWLRVVLEHVHYGPEQRRLLRLNKQFSVFLRPFSLTQEYEDLYALYRASITFDAPETIEAFLLAGATHNVFTTSVLEVRDGHQLIAAGIFDTGARSIAGIMNFYHPSYRKHSLGKYLMLLKINHALAHQKAYYYPGYLVHNYPKFDYKLFPCLAATEVFDSAMSRWLPFSWDVVAAQAADLLTSWPPEFLDDTEAQQ
ncbi:MULTISPECIES: GNAT family N-acetyltransferase [Hymenobacter]|uniref:Arginine-tRNA-protein transferase n=1 Tax=Hymenobacter mucosus TaxID=1411120 RepID=A0A238WTV7_9BACT|nr:MULTISPECIES: GNAT family N-acetyltransferase [Hymenobacter]SNR49843.1 arginine-tRNA-protein transferase [Hymenobacter mucosus]